MTTTIQYKNLVGFQNKEGRSFLFHPSLLELAEIDRESFGLLNEVNHKMNPTLSQQLSDWNLDSAVSKKADAQNTAPQVSALTLNLTQICNLACSYCVAGGDGTYGERTTRLALEKAFPQIELLMSKRTAGQIFRVTLLGGEPLLNLEGLKSTVDYCFDLAAKYELLLQMTLITNGTLINVELTDFLASRKILTIVSIDAPPEINDRLRPSKNGESSTEQTVRGLKLLLAKNLDLVMTHSVFSKQHTDVVGTYSFLKNLGVQRFEMTFDILEKDEAACDQFLASLTSLAEQVFASRGEVGLREIVFFDQLFDQLDSQIPKNSHCGAGKSVVSLDSKANAYSCPLDVGNSLAKIGPNLEPWNSKFKHSYESFIELNDCQTCWARHLCGGGCLISHQSLTGSKYKKHPVFCKKTRSMYSLGLLYYAQSRGEMDEGQSQEETYATAL